MNLRKEVSNAIITSQLPPICSSHELFEFVKTKRIIGHLVTVKGFRSFAQILRSTPNIKRVSKGKNSLFCIIK